LAGSPALDASAVNCVGHGFVLVVLDEPIRLHLTVKGRASVLLSAQAQPQMFINSCDRRTFIDCRSPVR
jgi:hypothetical protein